MNQLLRNYIEEDKKTRNFTYNPGEDVKIFVDNIINEFPRLTSKELQIIYRITNKLFEEENEFFKCEDLYGKDLIPANVASYELIWINHMKELIEEL